MTTTPYTTKFLQTRRGLLCADWNCPTPGEIEGLHFGEDGMKQLRQRDFWQDADSLDAEIFAFQSLQDPFVVPPKSSFEDCTKIMALMLKRLARHRRRYEAFFNRRVKQLAARKVLRFSPKKKH